MRTLPSVDRVLASAGEGVRVAIVDSGIEFPHPALAGPRVDCFATVSKGGGWEVIPVEADDGVGHGTACAGIVRSLAPRADVTGIRILGQQGRGSGDALLTALRFCVENQFDLVNLSLSTARQDVREALVEVADQAAHGRTTLVCAANNLPIRSLPWALSSVISVGAHGLDDQLRLEFNDSPPVDFFARGVRVPVAWRNGGHKIVSGNSFAAPHVTGLAAKILATQGRLFTWQLKYALSQLSSNLYEGP